MWLDTKVNGELQLLNMAHQKQLRIETYGKCGTSYQLRLGLGYYGDVIGIFEDLPAAVAAYENICAALKRGDHYYKVWEDSEGAVDVEHG